jgi:hypothetical protein
MRQVLGAVAEFNRRELVGKLAKARKRIRTECGRCEGRKPYGEREGEEAGLARVLSLVKSEGQSLRSAAATLNAEGVPTRSGKPWQAGSVASVVNTATSSVQRLAIE